MKLEYLNATSRGRIIALYDFNTSEANQLRQVFADLASGAVTSVEVHAMPFIESVNDCRMTLQSGKRDVGIVAVGLNTFECTLRPLIWDNNEGLTQPFCNSIEPNSAQYLDLPVYSEIQLSLSPAGKYP
jgi:hypothetical protein